MRVTKENYGLKVNAIAGKYVVMFGINYPEDKCAGLLGFSIHREDPEEKEAYYLEGMKCFEATDPGLPDGTMYPTDKQPIQSGQITLQSLEKLIYTQLPHLKARHLI